MRFLGVGETCDLASMYIRLRDEGHEVRVAVSEESARGTAAGLVEMVTDWRAHLAWVREAGDQGIILYESVSEGFGQLQDDLRRDGYNVIGGSAFGDRLENDRAFGQRLLANLGFPIARHQEFTSADAADKYVAEHPGRYVLKFSGADHVADDTYVGQLPDGADIQVMLAAKVAGRENASFILMEHLEGVEMGVGAYFDGERFLEAACLDWEHKRFFAGDLGELTGEMGTVATFDRTTRFFERTLKRLEAPFRAAGHVGYVNLNTIVNADGIWPLEFTCRFGYPGFAILEPLQGLGWSELFSRMIARSGDRMPTRDGYCVGVVMTTPPFPYSRHEIVAPVGLPVSLDPAFNEDDRLNIHYGEVGLGTHGLVTSGVYGWTMVVTGIARTIESAKAAAYARVRRILIPNVRYRLDIGDRLMNDQLDQVEKLGLIDRNDR